MDYVKPDIRDSARDVARKPYHCTACAKKLGAETYTHDYAFITESYCSEECASKHYWEIFASDTYLGVI